MLTELFQEDVDSDLASHVQNRSIDQRPPLKRQLTQETPQRLESIGMPLPQQQA